MRRAFLKTALAALCVIPVGVFAKKPQKTTIVKAKCVGCGDCVRACPVKAISLVDGKAFVNQDVCVGCRLCVMTCSYGAPQ